MPANHQGHSHDMTSSASARAIIANIRWITQAGAAAMVIGGAGPWAVTTSSLVDIEKAPGAAAVVLVGGIANSVLNVRYYDGKSGSNALQWLIGIAALSACASVAAFVYLVNTSSQALGLVRPGWGIYLSLVACILTGLCGGLALLLRTALADRHADPSHHG